MCINTKTKYTIPMKKLISIIFCFTLFFILSCTHQNSDSRQNAKISGADLFGKWKQVSTIKSLTNSESRIDFFHIINDSTVDVHVVDSTGNRKFTGKWESEFVKNISFTQIEIKSDVIITYTKPDGHLRILSLVLEEKNGKTILLAHNYRFEKE